MKHLAFAKNSVKLLLRMLRVKFGVMDIGQELWKKMFVRPIEGKSIKHGHEVVGSSKIFLVNSFTPWCRPSPSAY